MNTPATVAAMPPPGNVLGVLVRNEFRAYLRNRTSIFWVFVFPVLLFCTLGLALSGGSTAAVSVDNRNAGAQSADLAAFLERALAQETAGAYRVVPAGDPRATVSLVIPAGPAAAPPALQVTTAGSAAPGVGAGVLAAARQASLRWALEHQGATPIAVSGPEPAATVAAQYRRFLFSGVLVLMLLSGGVLSLALMLAGQREQGILKLAAAWPVSPLTWLAAVVGTRAAVMLVAAISFLALGHCLLDVPVRLEPSRLACGLLVIVLACLLFLAIGFVVASRSGGSAGAELLGNVIYYPMLLLGDLTIPLHDLPLGIDRWLRWLPTSQVVAGLRQVLWGTGALVVPWALYLYMAGGIVACMLVAGRSFRFTPAGDA